MVGANVPHPGNYFWTHGHWVRKEHTNATCGNEAKGHKDNATAADTKGEVKTTKAGTRPDMGG